MKKKLFSILLCSLLVISLSGCGSKKEEENVNNEKGNIPVKRESKEKQKGFVIFSDTFDVDVGSGLVRKYMVRVEFDVYEELYEERYKYIKDRINEVHSKNIRACLGGKGNNYIRFRNCCVDTLHSSEVQLKSENIDLHLYNLTDKEVEE